MQTRSALSNLCEILGARVEPRAGGDLVVVEQHVASNGPLGIERLGMLLGRDEELGRAVFLDIETTGLTSGAGTLVALVGLAWLDQRQVIVRQYLLHDPAVEPVLLDDVAEHLRAARTLVSFNGKCFDQPLLLGRYLLHRRRDPFPRLHLDLLHPARRIWRRRLRQASLLALEARVLGVVRPLDIPGAEIPARYFDFIRGDTTAMLPVVEHNRQDLITLVHLAQRVAHLLGHDLPAGIAPSDLLGLGRLCEAVSQADLARRSYEAALTGASPGDRAEALYQLATLQLRAREYDQAIALLEGVASYTHEVAVAAAIDLAKLYEHQKRDPARALQHAQRARHLVAGRGDAHGPRVATDLTRRIERLSRKVAGRSPAT